MDLIGEGASSQWNSDNWEKKGTIGSMPADTLCCLFVANGSKMEHTGFGLNGETVECSSGVQHFTSRNKKWTHWAIPKGLNSTIKPEPVKPDPEPAPEPGTAIVTGNRLALRKGPGTNCSIITRIDTGKAVRLAEIPDGWTYVEYGGKCGFVMDQYIKKG